MQDSQSQPTGGFSANVSAQQVTFGPGFAVRVSAEKDINITQGGALVIASGANMDLSFGGGLIVASGRDQTVTNGGAVINVTGRDLTLSDGGALFLKSGGAAQLTDSVSLITTAPQVITRESLVGVVISPHVELTQGSRVLLSTPQALAFGAAFGAVFGLLSWLFRRR